MAVKAGPILDGLGVTLELGDGDLVTAAVVLLRVMEPNGKITLLIEDSENMCWLDQLALVAAADTIIRAGDHNDGE